MGFLRKQVVGNGDEGAREYGPFVFRGVLLSNQASANFRSLTKIIKRRATDHRRRGVSGHPGC